MTRQVERVVTFIKATVPRSALATVVALYTCIWGTTVAVAEPDTAEFHKGACEGAYPGYLRGIADGYDDLSDRRMDAIPNPAALSSGDETLGYRAGLWAGYKVELMFGVSLAKAAQGESEPQPGEMMQPGVALNEYLEKHCGAAPASLEGGAVPLNQTGTATVATLNEALIAMTLAYWTNQSAIAAERAARGAHEAETKGDKESFSRFRDAAQKAAQQAANFALQAQSYAETGKEEAVPAVNDAQAAADRAKKAADSLG